LAELGISQAQSHRWQKIAGIPLREFEAFIGARKQDRKELTSISVLRLAQQLHRQVRQQQEIGKFDAALSQPTLALAELCSTVVVDPPWDLLGRPELLSRLPIPAMCARNAHVYLWVTNKTLEQGFELLRLWGFRYATCLTWCKSAPEEGPYYRSSTEHILFGIKGNLELTRQDTGTTWFQWPWGSIHSEKPDRFYELVMTCSPGPYAVLFSDKQRPGWTSLRLDLKTVTSMRQQPTSPFTSKHFSTPAVAAHCAV
jgi:N6-adenosine-specific RNA methylase IME4